MDQSNDNLFLELLNKKFLTIFNEILEKGYISKEDIRDILKITRSGVDHHIKKCLDSNIYLDELKDTEDNKDYIEELRSEFGREVTIDKSEKIRVYSELASRRRNIDGILLNRGLFNKRNQIKETLKKLEKIISEIGKIFKDLDFNIHN